MQLVLPTTDDDTPAPNASEYFRIVSIEDDGANCDVCKIRIGVHIGPEGADDPKPLPARFSVLGVSYSGSERIDVKAGLDDDDSLAVRTFSRVLRYAPVDTTPTTPGIQGIAVVNTSDQTKLPNANVSVATTTDADGNTVPRVSGRTVWFVVNATNYDADADPVEATSDETFDITYLRQAGALPLNALNPDAPDRPKLAMSNGARARITSSNDTAFVDAETQGPSFANPMPAHKSGTGSNSEMLSIDVTDALAGVKKDSITFIVRAGSVGEQTVKNSDLTITDIEGGYRASIALNKVRNMGTGTTLSVSTSRETPINWYVIADDNAGNNGKSDSNPAKRDKSDADASEDQTATATPSYGSCYRRSAGSDDCYTFTVDGLSPSMQRAYTGDWFNAAESRVEGDRRVSRDNYLPGSGSKTSVRVVFNEPLDGSTVSADDFTVDGTAPDAAMTYASGSTDGADGADNTNGEIRRSVFLTVAEMDTNETPAVVLTGSVSDLAGNPVSSGSTTAIDGLAPGATLSMDKAVAKKTVTVTVVTDEAIRLQSPDLKLWVSDAIDAGHDADLDEMDTFTVERETKDGPDDDTNPLVIRATSGEAFDVDPTVSGNWNLQLSKYPILDRSGNLRGGVVDYRDLKVEVFREATPATASTDSVVTATGLLDNAKAVRDATKGQITLRIRGEYRIQTAGADTPTTDDDTYRTVNALDKGDKIVVTYRGTDPDPANQFTGVPTDARGVPVTGAANTWTYELSVTNRDDRYAATVEMEDGNLNKGMGGVADPKKSGATVFEIDSQLASDTDTDATSETKDGDSVAINDPLYIDLNWEKEADEYVGDSHNAVTLTKAELDGTDILANAVAQDANSYRIRIDGISLGAHTLVYNGQGRRRQHQLQ